MNIMKHKSAENDITETQEKEMNPFEKMRVEKRLKKAFDDEEDKKKSLFVPFYFVALMLYMELVFHIYSFHGIDWNIIAVILFSTAFAGLIGILCSLAGPKVNYFLTIAFTALFSIYFCVQIVYKGVFQNYLSLSAMMGVAGQAFDYQDTIIKNVLENIVALILLLIPIPLIMTPFRRLIDFKRKSWLPTLIHFGAPFVVYLLGVLFLKVTDTSMYSAYDIFMENTSIDMTIEKLGVTEGTVLDLGALVGIQYSDGDDFEFTDAFSEISSTKVNTDDAAITPSEIPVIENVSGVAISDIANIVIEPVIPRKPTNILNINFDELIAATSDDGLISLNEYFRDCTPTNTNEYTGMFEGYNLIFITAEGFSGYALTEENYPTMYKMAHEGFVFNNYYSPLWYGSTVGGEYANLTGLMPANGQYLSLKETGKRKNDMRLTLATQLASIGYASVGYHDNTYTYYGRDMSHTNMGYTWVGVGNGWEPQRNKSGKALWPQSDDYMVETTFYDYCDTEPFNIYYLSVSGHVQYNFVGNAMAVRNKDVFTDSGYSETTRAYLSCQYELEKALTRLNEYLEKEGMADHTLIVLAPDHVPYDNKEVCDELAGHVLDDNFEWFENTLIIWSASMKEPIEVNKVCSSLDILPTVSNLMGLEYDSRLLVGRDILSDTEGLVMFNNRSWITDSCMYNAKTGEITYLTEEPVSDEYISAVKSTVKTRFKVAEKILEYNYYQYIEDQFEAFEPIVPVRVADKMAAAGFHSDGTAMSAAEIREYKESHPVVEETTEETNSTTDGTSSPANTTTPDTTASPSTTDGESANQGNSSEDLQANTPVTVPEDNQ